MKHSEPNVPAYVGHMTIPELKALIKECLREIADGKQFSENNYKALWEKPPTTTDGFKCNG